MAKRKRTKAIYSVRDVCTKGILEQYFSYIVVVSILLEEIRVHREDYRPIYHLSLANSIT